MKRYTQALLYVGLALAEALLAVAEPRAIDALPLAFEQNQGQSEADVRFVLRRGGRAALLLQDRVVFGVGNADGSAWTTMRWSGANPEAVVEGVGQTSIKTHYYIGNDPSRWLQGVPSFEKVRYSGVYAGIDLELYHHDGELEYDFIVFPGADASQIRLTFEGPVTPTLSEAGALQFDSEDGVIEHRKPELYQLVDGERRPVAGRFIAAGKREFRFETGDYDRQLALIVDPKVRFSSYIGRGSARETVNAVVQVSGDDLVAAGTTLSLDDFPGLVVAPRPTGANGFAVRLRGEGANPETYMPTEVMIIGGSNADGIYDVIESPQGVLLGGNTNSADFPFGAPLGGTDMFVAHWANGGGLDQGARFGNVGEDVFRGFARRNELGVPQMSVYDYGNAGYPSFVTSGKIFAGGGEYIQIRQWNANTFQPVRERHLLSQNTATIESTRLQWSEPNSSFFMAGSANGDLFPAAALTGSPGTFRPFLAQIPMEAPSLSTAAQPVDDVKFLSWPGGAPEDEIHISGLALDPVSVYPENPDYITARASGTLSDQLGLRGAAFRLEGDFLATALTITGDQRLPDIFTTRSLNYAFPIETTAGGALAGQRRGSTQLRDWKTSASYGATSFTNQYSFENTVVGAAPMANGKDLIVFGGGDKWTTTSGDPQANGPADGWLAIVEFLSLYPDAIVTAGQFQWAPLAPYGIYTIFYEWPRIEQLQVQSPVNGAFPKTAQGIEVILNGEPAAITAISGSQINFIAHHNVNMSNEATVQLRYDDGNDSFESNIVKMPTADRWVNPFESNGIAAATHSNGFLLPDNPLQMNDVLVWYFAGGGSLGDDSISADELTPGDKAFAFPGTMPTIRALIDGGPTFDLSLDYFGNSPGSTPGLGQFNVRFPQQFWEYCAANTNLEFTLTVTDTTAGSQATYDDPLNRTAASITETQAFATCP